MKKIVIRIVNLIIVAFIAVFMIGYAFAWFGQDRRESNQPFYGSSGTPYFESGNGTSGNPFIISAKNHMYNLAWLQNTGRLNEKYYFRVRRDFDMGDTWLPPIGNDDFPFKGDFNGNGKTISNLKITTDKDKLKNSGMPDSSVLFSNAVGMFGMTGDSSSAEIHNFILNNPIVEVATSNNNYSSSTSNMVAGIAIGYLNKGCKAYSIGVLAKEETKADGTAVPGAQLFMKRVNNYSTFNSIIGALHPDVSSSVTGGGHVVSTGGDTSIFNPSQFFTNDNFNYTDEETNKFMSSDGLLATTWLVSVKGKTTKDANGNDIIHNSSDHLGIGNFAFINETTTAFSTYKDASIVNNTTVTYKSVTYKEGDVNGNVTDPVAVTLNDGSDYANKFVNTSGGTISSFSNCLYMENSPKYDSGKTSKIKVVDESNTVLQEEATDYSIPLNVILVNIVDTTKARLLVVAGGHKNSRSIAIKRLVEQTDSNGLSDFNFYSGYSRFATTATTNKLSVEYSTDDIKKKPGFILPLQGTALTAYEVDLRNRGNGIYALYSTNGGIDIFYLSVVGVEGGNTGSETGEVEEDKAVSAVDFIYDGVSIAQDNDAAETYKLGDFIVGSTLYQATQTSVYFDQLDMALKIVYLRKVATETDPETMKVTATGTTDPTGKIRVTNGKTDFEWITGTV